MENKKSNKKLIIFFVTLLALCALILVSVICVKRFINEKNTATSSYTNGSNQSNTKNDKNTQNKISEKNNTKDNKNENISSSTENNENRSDKELDSSNATNEFSNNTNNVNTSETELNNSSYRDDNSSNQKQSQNINKNISTSTSTNNSSSNNTVTRYSQDEDGDYTTKVEIEENMGNSEITESNNYQVDIGIKGNTDDNSNKSNIKEYDSWNLSVKDNEYSNLPIKINLLNAPYNNDEYCEGMLKQNYVVKLIEKPEQSNCYGFPESIAINNDGNLNIDTHIYTKTGNLDFSNTYFSQLGDYVFGIYPEDSNEELYQVIVTLRGLTTEEGYITGKTYSLIQIKSILKNGEKVDDININIENPNTCITIEKKKEKNSFWEKVYVDLYIDSYENEKYTVLDGNALEESINNNTESSSVKIGNHYVVRDENGIIPQTYKIADDGKVIVGRKYIGPIASICKIASVTMPTNLGLEKQDEYEIPAGTKYKAILSSGKTYREKYEIQNSDELRIAKVNADDNKIIITNLTGNNPKTGVFYTVIPFVLILAIAIVGIIIIKKTSYKNDEEDNDK